jgi:hypothetical protein
MTGHMTDHMSGRIWLLPFIVAATFVGAAAQAQTMGPDEAVDAKGAVTQKLALTEAQKHAIYNAVLQQRVRTSASGIPLAVGAPVPPSAALSDLPVEALPTQAAFGDPGATVLKYAMVEGKVVVIDSIEMRVVDVIHGGVMSGAVP